MKENNIGNAVTFYDLEWDTEFFGVESAKAILKSPITLNEWKELKTRFKDYQFISIMNYNSEPVNARLIGNDTAAFLTDVNIQFEKKLDCSHDIPKNITIHRALERNDQVVEMADFQFSKFTEDPELAKRGGDKVYRHWLINSFGRPDKYYAISRNETGKINGFLLYSYSKDVCVIELIAVSKTITKNGVGTSLFKAVENAAHRNGSNIIKVGTQVRNLSAINFYQKVGCKQVECNQIYHLWNL